MQILTFQADFIRLYVMQWPTFAVLMFAFVWDGRETHLLTVEGVLREANNK